MLPTTAAYTVTLGSGGANALTVSGDHVTFTAGHLNAGGITVNDHAPVALGSMQAYRCATLRAA